MEFCDNCGSLAPANKAVTECQQCGTSFDRPTIETAQTDGGSPAQTPATELEKLPMTNSGNIKKVDAMEWLENRDQPAGAELRRAMIEKPSDFTGSTFPTDISTIRVTGDPQFIETVAGLFSWIVGMEDYSRRVEINLQKTDDKETGEQTDNYALYLSVAERG
ncbi:hypothetical protein [Halomontanus rarus]|uniref:hypothetical protein n=1 Tax=Halomontanus rarus TaxID=3034020 RepID=UPI00293BD6EA|nr:hypothetical protein [Halovivax sp. KZCA124]